MHQIGVSNPNVPIFLPRVCTLVLLICQVLIRVYIYIYMCELCIASSLLLIFLYSECLSVQEIGMCCIIRNPQEFMR